MRHHRQRSRDQQEAGKKYRDRRCGSLRRGESRFAVTTAHTGRGHAARSPRGHDFLRRARPQSARSTSGRKKDNDGETPRGSHGPQAYRRHLQAPGWRKGGSPEG